MSEQGMTNPLKIRDRVQVAANAQQAVTDIDNEHPVQPCRRGTVVGIGLDNVHLLRVEHDGDSSWAWYRDHQLIRIKERAREAAAPTPEQGRLDKLEQRLNRLVGEAEQTRDTIARELVGLETQLEHYWDRLQALEQAQAQDSEHVCRRGADRLNAEAAVAAAQEWCELPAHDTLSLLDELRQSPQTRRRAAADVLEALPSLLRRIEQLEQSPRRSRIQIQAWQALERACREWWDEAPPDPAKEKAIGDALLVIDELPDDEPPPDSAPPLSEAGEEVLRLQADVDLLTAERDAYHRRNAQAIETLREVFDLRPGCDLITDAADDACEYPRELMRALGYDGVDGPLPRQCLRDVRAQREQMGRVRDRLANMLGHAPDDVTLSEMLTWIEPRVMVVRDLCETIPVEGLRGVTAGLDSFAGDDYCPAAVVSAALHELAALEDPPEEVPDNDDGPKLAQPMQDDPS
jgi:hypothetical protein